MRVSFFLMWTAWAMSCAPKGTEWLPAQLDASEAVTDVHGSSSNDVYVVGKKGLVKHFDGKDWTNIPTNTTTDFESVAVLSPELVWLSTVNGDIYQGNASIGFSKVDKPYTNTNELLALSAQEVFAYNTNILSARSSGFFYFNGSEWALVDVFGSYAQIDSMSGNSKAGVWVIEGGDLYWGREGNFREVTVPFDDWWEMVVARAPDDVWLSGRRFMLRFDGKNWTSVERPKFAQAMTAGWANDANDAWFGGEYGRLTHWNGSTLELKVSASQFSDNLEVKTLYGGAPNDMWAVVLNPWGDEHYLLRRYAEP